MTSRAQWQFSPPWWSWGLLLPLLALLLALGAWQRQRGLDKETLLAAYQQAQTQPPAALDTKSPAPPEGALRVSVRGQYQPERQLLHDNQTHQKQPGLHVWTPLRTDRGELVLVNRGWIALTQTLPDIAPPLGEVSLTGLWRALPRAGLRTELPCEPATGFPQRVNYPDAAQLQCLLGEPVAEGLLLLDPQAGGGYLREWNFSRAIPPERHYAYALQWWALALTLLVLFLKLNLKKRSNVHDLSKPV